MEFVSAVDGATHLVWFPIIWTEKVPKGLNQAMQTHELHNSQGVSRSIWEKVCFVR